MCLLTDRTHRRCIPWVMLLVVSALAILAAEQRAMAQAPQAITLGSLSDLLASAGMPFPATAVGSTSTAVTLPLQVNAAGTTITSIAAPLSQGGKQEYTITGTGCALNTALSAGTICKVTVTFSPVYPGYRLVPLQVTSSAGTFNFGMIGLGTGPLVALAPNNTIATVAGNGTAGDSGDGGPATSAEIKYPIGVALDSAGNLYFTDFSHNVIRKIAADTGIITTVAGNGTAGDSGDGGPATSAEIDFPSGMALDSAGNLYFADSVSNVVRKIAAGTGIITTVAGNGHAGFSGDNGAAIQAELDSPSGLALDSAGNLYIADTGNCFIRKVDAATGTIATAVGPGYFPKQGNPPTPAAPAGYFGDGSLATQAWIDYPHGIALDQSGDIYIADTGNNVIREVNASTKIITTVVGNHKKGYSGDNGPATSAELNNPVSIAVDSGGNLYISDEGNDRIGEVAAASGIITTVVGDGTPGYSGDGGPAISAEVDQPQNIVLDSAGNFYIADSLNNRVREVNVLANQLNFATTPIGFTSSDSPQTATVSNIGNAPLVFSVPASGLNPNITPSFTMSNSSTCPQLDLTSSAASLASGDSCSLVLSFTPVVSGPINGTANIADNALGLAPLVQTVYLNAMGLPASAGRPDFKLTATPSSQMVNAGSTATYTVSVSGIYDFDGSVALAATGLPPGATVSINPSAVTVTGSTPTTATLTIVTASSQAKLVPTDRLPHGGFPLRYGFLLLPMPLLGMAGLRKRIRSLPRSLVLTVLCLLSLGGVTGSLTGCANIGLQLQPQTYTVTVTGTSGNLQRSANVTLTMQSYVTIKY